MWVRWGVTNRPRANKIVPIVVENARNGNFIQSYGMWSENSDKEVVWFGNDGKKITAHIIAWYEVPPYVGQ